MKLLRRGGPDDIDTNYFLETGLSCVFELQM